MVVGLLGVSGDLVQAEQIVGMIESRALKGEAARDLAVVFAKNGDLPNATRMFSHIFGNDEKARTCVAVVGVMNDEPTDPENLPYSPLHANALFHQS